MDQKSLFRLLGYLFLLPGLIERVQAEEYVGIGWAGQERGKRVLPLRPLIHLACSGELIQWKKRKGAMNTH